MYYASIQEDTDIQRIRSFLRFGFFISANRNMRFGTALNKN